MNLPRKAKWFRRLICFLGGAFLLLIFAYIFRAFILTELAEAWIVNDPVAKADAIVVLGGGPENRPFAAAKLFKEGAAPLVLYMDVKPSPSEKIGVTLSESEITRRILLSNGVPEQAMFRIGTHVGSTYDESKAVRAWLANSGAKSVIIPDDLFHTRRVRWLFRKQLRDVTGKPYVVAINPVGYSCNDWWRHEEGIIGFESEVIKFIYYRVKY